MVEPPRAHESKPSLPAIPCEPVASSPHLESTTAVPSAGDTEPLPGLSSEFKQRYRLVRVLGQGGNGVVWLANDLALERLVAVKVPRRDEHGPRQSQMDTIAEARRVAGLNIAGVVPVFDVLQLDDELAIVFKYIDGGSLADLIRNERISAERAARICQQVAETLSEAHLRDVIHRDIKPGNILLDSAGNAWISDFGLAILEHEQFRDRGLEVGTLAYMPPEQLSGGAHLVDARGDIYGLGVVMFELLTGRLPFVRTDARDYREAILLRQPRAPRSIERDVPQELERICLRCLAKDPADRYTTASDLAADLGRWLQSRASGFGPQETRSANSQPAISSRDPDQLGVLKPLHVGGWKRHLALALISAFVLGTIGIATVAGLNALRSATPTPAVAPSGGSVTMAQSTTAVPTTHPKTAVVLPSSSANTIVPSVESSNYEADGASVTKRDSFISRLRDREIFWPGFLQQAPLRWFDDEQTLHVTSKTARLITWEPLADGNASIEIEIRQDDWRGNCGIFYGYQEERHAESSIPVARFEAVFIAREQFPGGGSRLRIRHQRLEIDRLNGNTKPVMEHGYEDVAWPEASNFARLAIEVERGALFAARWNRGTPLTELGIPLSHTDFNGNQSSTQWKVWGLLHEGGTTQFRIPTIVTRTKP